MRDSVIYKLVHRLVEISVKHKLGHLGSCLTTLPIIYEIYSKKRPHDKFVLSNGHSGLSLYVVLEHFHGVDAEYLLEKHGIHPDRDLDNFIDVSTGSLGLGLTVATGLALGDKTRDVYCVISDGECAEGSIWEALRFISDFPVENIHVHCNVNGWSAYQSVDTEKIQKRLESFLDRIVIHKTDLNEFIKWETPLSAHYTTATNEILNMIKEKL